MVALAVVAAIFMVTVKPPSMNTLSEGPGTPAPGVPPEVCDQVEVWLQLPVATENLSALHPRQDNAVRKNTIRPMRDILNSSFLLNHGQ